MPRRLQFIVLSLLFVAGVVLAGPRERLDAEAPIDVPALPATLAELPDWLAQREAQVPALRPAAAKQIVWADATTPVQTPIAVVYLHGYSATRVETAPLADSVAAALGANLFYTRLRGHGRDGAAMAEARPEDWLRDTREALAIGQRLGERVVVIGTSTGGTLGLWAAAEAPEREALAGLVLISPNFAPADPRSGLLTAPWGGWLARLVQGPEYRWQPANDAQAAGWTTAYPTAALPRMMALVDAVNRPDLLARVETPTLMLYAPGDQVIDVEALGIGFEALGADIRERVAIDDSEAPSQHVIAGDVLSPGTTQPIARRIVAFLTERAGVGPAPVGPAAPVEPSAPAVTSPR